MPIEDLAPRFRELGRLKFGEDLGDRPAQLNTWRLTSSSDALIVAASALWGGEVKAPKGERAEVITETDALEVLIPPQDLAAGQWYELWAAGGLQRRCNGARLVEYDAGEADGWRKTDPCICEAEEAERRTCKVTTVLRVLLPQLPDIGVWRLTTRSIYAAGELPPAADFLLAASHGQPAPAILALETRSTKRPGQGRREYVVPVLRTLQTLAELAAPIPQGSVSPQASQAALDRQREVDALSRPASTPDTVSAEPAASSAAPPWDAWDGLAAFLAETDPSKLPANTPGLLAVLEELETLTLECGLWKTTADGSPLDAAALRWLDPPSRFGWRAPDAYTVDALRSFAKRALLAATADLAEDPAGYQASQEYRRRSEAQ